MPWSLAASQSAPIDTAGMEGTLRLLPDELTGYFWSESGGPAGPDGKRQSARPGLQRLGDAAGVLPREPVPATGYVDQDRARDDGRQALRVDARKV